MRILTSLLIAISLLTAPAFAQEHGHAGASHMDNHAGDMINRGPERTGSDVTNIRITRPHDFNYPHGYIGANRGWVQRPWNHSTPYHRIYRNGHWGFYLIAGGISTWILEDQINNCYYLDQYGNQHVWCDDAYTNTNECVCP